MIYEILLLLYSIDDSWTIEAARISEENSSSDNNAIFVLLTMGVSIVIILTLGTFLSIFVAYHACYSFNDVETRLNAKRKR